MYDEHGTGPYDNVMSIRARTVLRKIVCLGLHELCLSRDLALPQCAFIVRRQCSFTVAVDLWLRTSIAGCVHGPPSFAFFTPPTRR